MESFMIDLAITWFVCVTWEICAGFEWVDDDQPVEEDDDLGGDELETPGIYN